MSTLGWLHRKLVPYHVVKKVFGGCSENTQKNFVRCLNLHEIRLDSNAFPVKATMNPSQNDATSHHNQIGIRFTDYDCLGFDLDNTISRFKIGSVVRLEYEMLSKYLVSQKGYSPVHLMKPIDENIDFMLKGLILDVENGNILRIAPNGHILHGSHGTTELTREELTRYYGSERRWNVTDAFSRDPLVTWNGPYSTKMRTLLDYFDMPAGLTFARAVDTLDEKNGGVLKSYSIWPDLLEAIQYMYQKEHFQLNKGGYFERIKAEPENYIHKCSESLICWFKEMRARNKLLFLVTGSNVDFASHTATNSIGPDWRQLFDIVICYAKKPGFFTSNRPFIALNGFEEIGEIEENDLQRGGIYTNGNWAGVHRFLKKYSKCKEPKIVYFGDNLVQDIYTPAVHTTCDTVAVCEELQAEGLHGHDGGHNDRTFLVSSTWGSYFCHGHEDNLTIWQDIINKHSKTCIPSLEYVATKPVDYEYLQISRV